MSVSCNYSLETMLVSFTYIFKLSVTVLSPYNLSKKNNRAMIRATLAVFKRHVSERLNHGVQRAFYKDEIRKLPTSKLRMNIFR